MGYTGFNKIGYFNYDGFTNFSTTLNWNVGLNGFHSINSQQSTSAPPLPRLYRVLPSFYYWTAGPRLERCRRPSIHRNKGGDTALEQTHTHTHTSEITDGDSRVSSLTGRVLVAEPALVEAARQPVGRGGRPGLLRGESGRRQTH